ncbi:MAG: UDP-N-acetylmuramoyl-L-alanine--D-glutamate ligase [Bacteroidales bacterium]|nr:UDP-N-acetylmuramoyl-L-alanine--D-glutamate ligase [Bacteroidales bacterium]
MNRIVVLGAGESGVGAAILAKKKGFEVFVSDKGTIKPTYKNVLSQHEISFEEGKHSEAAILSAREVVKSPGIPDHIPMIKKIKEQGIRVISEIEFAGRYTGATMICITGSNGKTTTTLLTYHILKNGGLNVGLGGNVGQSFAWQVARHNFDYYVLEVSSFQLDGMFDFKADIAVLLNITPDHLDRYNNSFERYIQSKMRITQNQTHNNALIYCIDDETINNEIKGKSWQQRLYPFSTYEKIEGEGAYLAGNKILFNVNSQTFHMTIEELALQGRHNIHNSMAAGIASRLVELRKNTIKQCLSDFQNVEHRLEHVANIHGIEFINDSKATNINATWYALESAEKPVVWIVGGIDKGNDYSKLMELVKEKVKAIVCLGVDNHRIHEAFDKAVETIIDTSSANEAVGSAYYLSTPGDMILLSPACASFDLFENYEDRGNQFKQAVSKL